MNSLAHNLVWLIRRELIEHRRLMRTPWVIAALLLVLNIGMLLVGSIHRSNMHLQIRAGANNLFELASLNLQSLSASDTADLGRAIALLLLATLAIFAVALLVSLLSYALSCLFDERRDRSILFWKSLPVGDGESVAAKALVALLVMPVVWVLIALLTGWLSMAVYLIPLLLAGADSTVLFSQTHLLSITALVLAALPVYLLALAPAVGWLMICSATARRHPLVLAIMVPAVFAVLGALGLPNPIWRMLAGRLAPRDFSSAVSALAERRGLGEALAVLYQPVASLELWLGVLLCAICLIGATIYRRRFTTLI
ncbi:hypothetical protein V5738_15290 [Salinisphaera sp. SPP-AMP-43]|uniref:hypothetical protein n=1 Tax=Salinisphaera sp. SPP-AMP-43 TaxID=3121288 RepID=UPI003C6E981A